MKVTLAGIATRNSGLNIKRSSVNFFSQIVRYISPSGPSQALNAGFLDKNNPYGNFISYPQRVIN